MFLQVQPQLFLPRVIGPSTLFRVEDHAASGLTFGERKLVKKKNVCKQLPTEFNGKLDKVEMVCMLHRL